MLGSVAGCLRCAQWYLCLSMWISEYANTEESIINITENYFHSNYLRLYNSRNSRYHRGLRGYWLAQCTVTTIGGSATVWGIKLKLTGSEDQVSSVRLSLNHMWEYPEYIVLVLCTLYSKAIKEPPWEHNSFSFIGRKESFSRFIETTVDIKEFLQQ